MNRRKLFLDAITDVYEPDIATCAMIIAGEFQPGLDIHRELSVIDSLVEDAKSFPVHDVHSLVQFLAVEKGFTGNVEDYYSLSNSLLNQVLSSKIGIPITLALVYLSLVKNLKLDNQPLSAWGINFPGHFLVAVTDSNGEHLIDPFKGCLVTKDECYSIIAALYGRHHEPDHRYFERADNRQLLRRILENLKSISLNQGNADKAMVSLDYQLMLYPEDAGLLQQQDGLLKYLRDKGQSGESRLQ